MSKRATPLKKPAIILDQNASAPLYMSAQAVAHRAAAYGLRMLPISQFSLRPLQRDGLLLGFASASPQELRAGVQMLALALQAH